MLQIKLFLISILLIPIIPVAILRAQPLDKSMETNFVQPPKIAGRTPAGGQAVGSKEEITRELEQMRSHGLRGVEQISMGPVFKKGDVPSLSRWNTWH